MNSPPAETTTWTPLAASTSSALTKAGAEKRVRIGP